MRQLLLTAVATVATLALGAAQARAGKVEVKGVHLCCQQCATSIADILKKVEGVADASCDRQAKTVTFTADEKAAAAGVKALHEGGFFGAATLDGKEMKVEAAAPKKGEKADEITVKGVHVCCRRCETSINGLFKDAKVEYGPANGKLKDVKITGKGLDKAEVLETLRKEGLNGKIEK